MDTIRRVLALTDDDPSGCQDRDGKPPEMNWTTIYEHVLQAIRNMVPTILASGSSTKTTSPSKAHVRYTPATTAGASLSNQTLATAVPNPSATNNVGTHTQSGRGNNAPTNPLWTIFGIKDMSGFHAIENIETSAQLKDPSFFSELKRRHNRRSHFLKRWFSPFRFRYCRFVQVSTKAKSLR